MAQRIFLNLNFSSREREREKVTLAITHQRDHFPGSNLVLFYSLSLSPYILRIHQSNITPDESNAATATEIGFQL
jgi:hypothetical protein